MSKVKLWQLIVACILVLFMHGCARSCVESFCGCWDNTIFKFESHFVDINESPITDAQLYCPQREEVLGRTNANGKIKVRFKTKNSPGCGMGECRVVQLRQAGVVLAEINLQDSHNHQGKIRISNMSGIISNQSVVDFLHQFEKLAGEKDFDLLVPYIHKDAVFRFNDGDHFGLQQVRQAFEETWANSAAIQQEQFYLTDIVVVSTDATTATATYTYHWEGVYEGKTFHIKGRGTRVLVQEDGVLQIKLEHLSAQA